MRLFIAINFDEELKDSLCRAIDGLRAGAAKGRFTERENLHLTLVFLGDLQPNDVPLILRCMDRIEGRPFELAVGGLGRFRRPGGDICWAGVRPDRALVQLQAALSEALAHAGFEIDRRPFRPHLTLGREVTMRSGSTNDADGNGWIDEAASRALMPEETMYVERISLMLSERIRGRMVYTELHGRKLG